MGCGCSERGKITTDESSKLEKAMTIIMGEQTMIHMITVNGEEVYDYMETIDNEGNVIWTDRKDINLDQVIYEK